MPIAKKAVEKPIVKSAEKKPATVKKVVAKITAPATKAAVKPAEKKAAAKPVAKLVVKPAAVKPVAAQKAVAPAKPANKKAAVEVAAAPRKPNAAFMKPLTPSADLSAIVGTTPLPRTEVTKKVWEYIKKFELQNPENKRMIDADEKLKIVFGGKKQVSMFEMTKLISDHLK